MTDNPDRIWIEPTQPYHMGGRYQKQKLEDGAEYIKAHLFDEIVAVLKSVLHDNALDWATPEAYENRAKARAILEKHSQARVG